MEPEFFSTNLILFGIVTAGATFAQSYYSPKANAGGNADSTASPPLGSQQSGSARSLWRSYIVVYSLVMCADWLQGPYMYPLYSGEYGFSDRIVAALFVFGFSAGGVSAPFVGKWADKYGRKRMCLIFCGTYASSSIIVLHNNLLLLFIGRVLGGVSTSILFSCFESWLISSAHALHVSDSELSSILSRCTFINGLVATLSGVFSNVLVSYSGTVKSPFVASAVCLGLAAIAIRTTWDENYGESAEDVKQERAKNDKDPEAAHPLMLDERGDTAPIVGQRRPSEQQTSDIIKSIFKDASLLTLGITQTLYETAMYLFVFLWVPALQIVAPAGGSSLPFGIIFSAFMVCMSLGSLIYSVTSSSPTESVVKRHSALASTTCLVAAGALVISATSGSLAIRFWAFCAFEMTVGMYFPILGTLRGNLIPDEARASFSALFRVPLNILVTISLLTGAEEHKDLVILASVAMLAFASLAMVLGIRKRVA